MTDQKKIAEFKLALKVASDWNIETVQVYPPKEWGLDGGESEEDGWCSTYDLAVKLEQLSK